METNNQVLNQLIELQRVAQPISKTIPMMLPETTKVVTKPLLSLTKILESLSLVLENYKTFNSLNDAFRLILVDMIIKTDIKENVTMRIITAEKISNQIVATFPNKVKVFCFQNVVNV